MSEAVHVFVSLLKEDAQQPCAKRAADVRGLAEKRAGVTSFERREREAEESWHWGEEREGREEEHAGCEAARLR